MKNASGRTMIAIRGMPLLTQVTLVSPPCPPFPAWGGGWGRGGRLDKRIHGARKVAEEQGIGRAHDRRWLVSAYLSGSGRRFTRRDRGPDRGHVGAHLADVPAHLTHFLVQLADFLAQVACFLAQLAPVLRHPLDHRPLPRPA